MMGGLVLGFYALIAALVAVRFMPWSVLLVFITLPRGIKVAQTLGLPMPDTPAAAFRIAYKQIPRDLRERFDPSKHEGNFPLWPLWYVVWGVWWVRSAGAFFVLGLGLAFLENPLLSWLGF